jgi:hypothetical protein
MEDRINRYRVLVEKPEKKRLLGRHTSRWEDDIKIYYREIGWGVSDWFNLAQDKDWWWAIVNTEMNLWVL